MDSNKVQQSSKCVRRLIQPDFHIHLQPAYSLFKRYPGSRRLLAADPRDGVAYSNRGYAYRKLGDYAAAAADYKLAIQLSPASVRLHNNRAYCFAKLGKYEVRAYCQRPMFRVTRCVVERASARLHNNRA